MRAVFQKEFGAGQMRSIYKMVSTGKKDILDSIIIRVIGEFMHEHKILPSKIMVSRAVYDYFQSNIETFGMKLLLIDEIEIMGMEYVIRIEGEKV